MRVPLQAKRDAGSCTDQNPAERIDAMKEAVLALVALALLTVSPPDAPVERPVPFRVGETLTYDVSWSTWLTAGKVVATVRDKRPSYSSTAYYIVAEGRPTPLVGKLYSLYYKMDTLLDASTLLSQRGSLYSEEGRRHRFRTTLFDLSARKATFEYHSSTTVRAELAVASGVTDALAALYVLRTLPMHAGDRLTLPVSDDGTNYRVQLDVNAPERLTVPFGTV